MSAGATVYCDALFNYFGGPATMPVLDGRQVGPAFDDEGCVLLEHRSEVRDWGDQHELDTVHAAEIGDLAQSFTGCDAFVVYPAIVRSPASSAAVPDYAPIELVHSDFTEDYWGMVTEPDRPYRAFIDPALHDRGLRREDLIDASRLMVLQLWRNTGPVEADRPFALCDVRDIGPERHHRFLVPEYGGQRLEFETLIFSAPGRGSVDRWYTFPRLEAHEVVVFRTYDSERVRAGLPFFTPHSAFRDPAVPATPEHARTSVEMRVLCIWR